MDNFVNLYLLIYIAVFAFIVIILTISFRKERKKPKRISQSRHVQIQPTDSLESIDDSYSFDWKPDKTPQIPEDVLKAIDSVQDISPMVVDLSARISDPDINPQEISQIIASDQGLTSYVLKRVNSPFYGLVQKIDNIFNAIVILGYNEIHRIVMEERMSQAGIQPSKSEWVHANLTSNIAASITTASRSGVPGGTMVTVGMLHDIGKTILQQIKPLEDGALSTDPREQIKQEFEIYGVDHATVGAELARRWRIPERICRCIEMHHQPMFWPLREIGNSNPDIIKEIGLLSIADIAALNFSEAISGSYIGNDYYNFLKLPSDIGRLLTPKLQNDLYRITSVMQEENK